MARFVKTSFNSDTQIITWTFPGTQLAPVTLAIQSASAAVRAHAMVHGFVQTCSDPAASEKTAEGKRKAIAARAEFLGSGGNAWAPERVSGVGSRFDSGAVIAAMARVLFAGDVDRANRAAETVATKRAISRDDALRLFAQDERIADDMARAARAKAPKVDANTLLADMVEEPEAEAEEEALTQE